MDPVRDTVGDNVPQDDPHQKPLEDIIYEMIRGNSRVTRQQIADIAGVSVKTVSRKLKDLDDVIYVGSGNNGHWEILES